MPSNQNLNKGSTENKTFVGSRAYTFIDSYIYMKNKSYNALYEKNKDILLMENEAIKTNSPKILYNAFFEQMRILDSVVARIRDFLLIIKNDVMNNINLIMPDEDLIAEYDAALDKVTLLPRFKYVKYNIVNTKYMNMTVFFNLFKNEIEEFCKIKDATSNFNHPLLHSKATNFLIDNKTEYLDQDESILEMEEIKIVTLSKLTAILRFFQKKSVIKQLVKQDFKMFHFYLRQYKALYDMTLSLKPTIVGNDIQIDLSGTKYKLSFNDYLVLYKHFSMMSKYMLDIVNEYNTRFFNKIYALQSNIEVYRSIMIDVIDYANNKDVDTVNETTNSFNDIYGLVNGNDATEELLMDDASDDEEDKIQADEIIYSDPNKEV